MSPFKKKILHILVLEMGSKPSGLSGFNVILSENI